MAEYIEREALYKEVTEKYHDINGGQYPFNVVAHDMAQLVKSAPAADVVEVVHGEWVITHDFDDNCEAMRPLGRVVRCSVCGYPTGHIKTKFCPECGAKMDGERTMASE